MWAPPFPPEEYDDYDDEAAMEGQVGTWAASGGGQTCGGWDMILACSVRRSILAGTGLSRPCLGTGGVFAE